MSILQRFLTDAITPSFSNRVPRYPTLVARYSKGVKPCMSKLPSSFYGLSMTSSGSQSHSTDPCLQCCLQLSAGRSNSLYISPTPRFYCLPFGVLHIGMLCIRHNRHCISPLQPRGVGVCWLGGLGERMSFLGAPNHCSRGWINDGQRHNATQGHIPHVQGR